MNAPASRRRSLWIGAVALAVLLLGLGVLVRQWWRPAMAPMTRPGADTSDAVVDEALRQIPGDVDSAAIKSRWMEVVKGVDVAALDRAQHEVFIRYANARRCTCGCGFTLAACRTYDPTCPISLPIAEKLRDSVRAGWIRSVRGLRERPGSEPHGG